VVQKDSGPLPHAGSGTQATPEGRALVATADGLAIQTADGASVVAADLILGDIGAGRTLSVSGNLVVAGSVGRGAEVRAGGFLVVVGPVFSARVEAMGSLVLRGGCNASTATAGANRAGYEVAAERVRALAETLGRLLAVLEQLKAHPAFRTLDLEQGLRPLLEILVERTFAGFAFEVAEALRRLRPVVAAGPPVAKLADMLEHRFEGGAFLHASGGLFEQAHAVATEAAAILAGQANARFPLRVTGGAVLESTLKASGDIDIRSGDCRNAQLTSGTTVRVSGRLLGGMVSAQSAIQARTAGADAVLQVPGTGVIRLTGVHGSLTFRIGQVEKRVAGVVGPSIIRLVGDQFVIKPDTEGLFDA